MHQEPDLLQSESWLRFQESTGRDVVRFSGDDFCANGIVHELPIVGKYLYVPRGPIMEVGVDRAAMNRETIRDLLAHARATGAKWVRIEPEDDKALEGILKQVQDDKLKLVKAPHDVQPREVLVMDISKPDAELLAGMKSKTRYNIRLAEKKGVRVVVSSDGEYRDAFVSLVRETALRKRLVPHPAAYYGKMLDVFLGKTGKLFVALSGDDILGINLVVHHGGVASYLHGGSAATKREYMAPFLLQWAAIRDARGASCAWYDFGGVKTVDGDAQAGSDWEGITRFKTGFAPGIAPRRFPGSYDIVLDRRAYRSYDMLRLVRENMVYLRKFTRI